MTPLLLSLAAGLLAAIGETLHLRRLRRTARLAFGPRGRARPWTSLAPLFRVAALMAVTWGLAVLWALSPRPRSIEPGNVADRHLVIALDVSPSMQLRDAGRDRKQTRARRASEAIFSILERADLSRLRVSVVAFYTEAKIAVVDTSDLAVVRNLLDDLPLELAFKVGQTDLLQGMRTSTELAVNWAAGSTTVLVASDGDTVPDRGLSPLPASVSEVLVLGVGSATGQTVDGHLSRQDSSTLRQLATRLNGRYFDANDRNLPTSHLSLLARSLPTRDETTAGRREWALAAVGAGATVLALLPVALALAGSAWSPGLHVTHRRRSAAPSISAVGSITP